MKYDAFISYSHSADGRLAPAVQSGLQRLARPWYRRRALRVFRDETGLTVNPHLWNSIADAMGDSRYFVLLASPDSADSPWVNQEIEHWLAHNPPDTLLPVLSDGTLVWDRDLGDFDADQSSALPAALVGVFVDEPRHLDMRWARDETDLDLRHSRFRAQIAALAAPIHGIDREDLEGEDIRLHRHARRLAAGAAAALAIFAAAALGSAGLAVSYAATADQQRERAVVLAARANRSEGEAQTQARVARSQTARAERGERTAESERDRANTNEEKANASADEAQANADEAQANADEAAANAARAQRSAADATAANAELTASNTQLTCANEGLSGAANQMNIIIQAARVLALPLAAEDPGAREARLALQLDIIARVPDPAQWTAECELPADVDIAPRPSAGGGSGPPPPPGGPGGPPGPPPAP